MDANRVFGRIINRYSATPSMYVEIVRAESTKLVDCPECLGTGQTPSGDDCDWCAGRGFVPQPK